MRKKLEDLLLQIGITPNLKGFAYICDMVEIIKADEKRERKFQDMYMETAKKNNTNWGAVERAIRHALSKANKESEAWKEYIGTKDATNAVVLCMLVYRLRED